MIAIETSAGLIAEESVIRTTCCAKVVENPRRSKQRALDSDDFITGLSALARFSGFVYNSSAKNGGERRFSKFVDRDSFDE